MKRIDRLILNDIVGPWLFGVAIFTVLIMAGTYLFKITDYVVKGISFTTVIELTLLLLPGIMAKTFPMAVLLATLLGFGRLSGDSEIIAVRAAGTSLIRVMVPVAAFGTAVAILAFLFNEFLVPAAALRGTEISEQIAQKLQGSTMRPTSYPISEDGVLKAMLVARDFSIGDRLLTGASVIAYDKDGRETFVLFADRLRFTDAKDWKIEGNTKLMSTDGRTFVLAKDGIWPIEVTRPTITPADIVASTVKDLDSLSMREMSKRIAAAKKNGKIDKRQIANLEYGFWNKLTLPLAALVYALVGAPLGIRNQRTGASTGFWMSVIIIFGYMMLANFMAIYAQGGLIPSWLASFLPLFIGLIVAGWAVYKKNT